MTTKQKQKLLKLADFLEHKVKSHWFNLDTWADAGFREKKCGTTACAMGWATVCFPRSLTLSHDTNAVVYRRPNRRDVSGFDASMEFFGISDYDAFRLFDPISYPENRQGRMSVVRRLRAFANEL